MNWLSPWVRQPSDRPPPTPQAKAVGAGAAGAGGIAAVILLAQPVIQHWEGRRLDPYFDIVHVKTVCYGETSGVEDRHYTVVECDAQLRKSLAKHAAEALACIPAATPLEAKAAFVSFAYNAGTKAACGSTTARKFRQGDVKVGCLALGAWTYAGGKQVQGLINRRADEIALCLKGVRT